jgi:hypothetical protein
MAEESFVLDVCFVATIEPGNPISYEVDVRSGQD